MYNEDMDEFENYEMMLRMGWRVNEFWERMANIRQELYDLPNKKEAKVILKRNYKENYYCVDEDTMVIWSFDGSEKPDYNELVKRHKTKKLVVNTGKGSVIPKAIFQDCKGIKTVKIMDGVTSIGQQAFDGCSGLTSVVIGNGVTSIGDGVFWGCSGLKSVTIGNGVTKIGDYAFNGCSRLTSITIPEGVTSIGYGVFQECSSLISVTIPNSVTSIDDHAFWGCANLKSLSISAHTVIDKVWGCNAQCKLIRRPEKEAEMAKNNKDVDLYDPKFVHFDWDDSLVGKDGVYADNMGLIMNIIRRNRNIHRGTLIKFEDDNAPFVVQSLEEEDSASHWRFFYYDPNYDIKWAYFKEGKTVQYRPRCASNWTVIPEGVHTTFFDDDCEYRIKPEDPKPEVEVNVDVKVNTSSNGKIKITINGKECIFENAEQARMVLQGN